jgi:hypothetical protein
VSHRENQYPSLSTILTEYWVGHRKIIWRQLTYIYIYTTKCSSNVIEDELHFLFECSKYDEDQESMLFEITTVCSNFRNLNSQNKLIWLFNSENIELLKTLCKFILKHLP